MLESPRERPEGYSSGQIRSCRQFDVSAYGAGQVRLRLVDVDLNPISHIAMVGFPNGLPRLEILRQVQSDNRTLVAVGDPSTT